jgi:SpoVK/Ycf46/Vps4 family AAA+-type ATPase
LRKGRFDEIFFVDLPTQRERIEIFKVHLEKRLRNPDVKGNYEINSSNLEYLSSLTEGFSGSEIEQIVISGLFEAYSEDRSVSQKDFENSISNTIPLSVTQSDQIRSIRDWANLRAVSATILEDRTDYKPEDDVKKEEKNEDIFDTRGGRAIDF